MLKGNLKTKGTMFTFTIRNNVPYDMAYQITILVLLYYKIIGITEL